MANAGKPLTAFGRQFYGELRNQQSICGAVLAEVVHEHARDVPLHTHDVAYFSLVLQGLYREGDARGRTLYGPLSATFNPRGTRHDGQIQEGGARFFTAELEESWLEPLQRQTMERHFADRTGGPLLWLTLQLYRNYRSGVTVSPLAAESLLWEMLATTARWRDDRDRRPPAWWLRVKEKLQEQFREPHRLGELAAEAGVHPVHLARVCRRFERRSVGEYVLALRVRLACELLRRPELPLAQVAMETGFADQSHLTRMFKRLTGFTPATFRGQLAAANRRARSPLS
ncbi:MAG TPA: AraC family transcriptional regulator [Terriglobales bacterium]|nr:AraC family transcriptional regulator [Terriglobales bacterium]